MLLSKKKIGHTAMLLQCHNHIKEIIHPRKKSPEIFHWLSLEGKL